MTEPELVKVVYAMDVHDEEALMAWVEGLVDDDETFEEIKAKPREERLATCVAFCISTAIANFVESEEPHWGIE